MNYYNEIDPKAAAWLRELMADNLIPAGDVDERSIEDVKPSDLEGYTQCHFFAGIGGWAYALRLADWPDDRPCFTGSCPCQPFSDAGKGGGVDDERHLWPAFRWIIAQCRPSVVFGEQVASKAGRQWVTGVHADMEGMDYVCGVADLCAAGVGAPHIRQRLWWVADSDGGRNGPQIGITESQGRDEGNVERDGATGSGLADDDSTGRGEQRRPVTVRQEQSAAQYAGAVDWTRSVWWPCRDGKWRRVPGRVANDERGRCGRLPDPQRLGRAPAGKRIEIDARGGTEAGRGAMVRCAGHDGLEVKPALFPLADGLPGRVGLLRGAGNAIVPEVAATFIRAWLETKGEVT